MSTLYIKILTDYFHHIIGDLEENRKIFLGKFYSYLLEKDEYGFAPVFEGELERIEYLLKQISLITDIHSLSENELQFIKDLDNFLNTKGRILKFFNVHNGKYQSLKEIL